MELGAVNAKDSKEVWYVEYVVMVGEDVLVIRIALKTPRMVLTYDIFLGISTVPIGMPFRGAVGHMLAVNAAVERLAEDVVTEVHVGNMAMAEDDIFQKLVLIGLTMSMDDVAAKYKLHRMSLALEEGIIDSYIV